MKSKRKTGVIFDKVGVTLPVVKSIRPTIKDNLINLMVSNDHDDYMVRHYKGQRYGNIFDFRVSVDTKIGYFNLKVSIYPRCKAHNFIRFEFNPTKLGTDGELKLRRLLIKILGMKMARAIYYEGRLTRVDTTIDRHGAVDNCYMYMKAANCSKIIRGTDGEIESQICGSNRSNIRPTLYDKTKERARRDRNRGDDVERVSQFRLEIVVRDLRFPMADIHDKLDLSFKKLSFFLDDFLDDEYFDGDFLAAVQADGLNAALSGLSRNDRTRYLRRLQQQYACDAFNLRRLTIKPGVDSLMFLKSTKYVPRAAAP